MYHPPWYFSTHLGPGGVCSILCGLWRLPGGAVGSTPFQTCLISNPWLAHSPDAVWVLTLEKALQDRRAIAVEGGRVQAVG